MKTRKFPPRIYLLTSLLYSMLFVGMYVPQIAMICLIATFPFLGLAYEFGMVAIGIFGSEFAYPFPAWIAVFIQAYCVAIICWNNREKLKARQ